MDSGIRGISAGKDYVFYKCELLYVYISLEKYLCCGYMYGQKVCVHVSYGRVMDVMCVRLS